MLNMRREMGRSCSAPFGSRAALTSTASQQALAERGDCPELQQADSAFVAQDPGLALRKSYTERWAQRAPSFCGQPPPNPGASLEDWYAWSLAARSEQPSDPP